MNRDTQWIIGGVVAFGLVIYLTSSRGDSAGPLGSGRVSGGKRFVPFS